MIEPVLYLPRVLLEQRPFARARLFGPEESSPIRGEVFFFPFQCGSLLLAAVNHLPPDPYLGVRILPGREGTPGFPLPPLLSAGGFAYSLFYTDRFFPRDVLDQHLCLHPLPESSFPGPPPDQILAQGIIRKV